MNDQEYIQQRLDDQQSWYESKSAWNQRWYKRLRLAELVLAAALPFVSSLMGNFPDSPNFIPFLISLMAFIIAAITSISALYRFHDNWIQYRTTAEQLKREKILFLTNSQPYDVEDAFHELVKNVERILGEENSSWKEQTKSQASSGAAKTDSSSDLTDGPTAGGNQGSEDFPDER